MRGFENYETFSAEVLDFLMVEAFSPYSNSYLPINNPKGQFKKNFNINSFRKDLPKGPCDIKTFKSNPFKEVIVNLKPPLHFLEVNLTKNVEFFDIKSMNDPIWIENEKDLGILSNDLKNQQEISVDLENHSYYSYYGFCCLIQISTRKNDYLIDAIALRDYIKPSLGPIFEDPNILKIFHGCESDIYWLQRDFGIFVVSIFDSYYASILLGTERRSLSFLIEHFFGVLLDKSHQTSDWRDRPLFQRNEDLCATRY